MACQPVTLASYYSLLRGNSNFRLLWTAQIVSEIGDWLYAVVIYSLLLQRTGSAKAVALAVVLQVLPQVLVAPMAGVVNDRLSRRTVMIAADLVRCVVVIGMLAASHMESIWPVYSLLLAETVMWGFFEPGRSAILPNVTTSGRELLVANALSSTTWSFTLAVGASLGGFLAVAFGRDAVFLINAASFLVSAAVLTRMRVEEPHVAGNPPMRLADLANFAPVIEGTRYIARDPRLLATLLAKFGLGLMGAHYVIIPIFGERIFPVQLPGKSPAEAGMLGMSLLMGARGIGALIGPIVGGYWAGGAPSQLRAGIFWAFLVVAAGYAGLGAAPDILIAIAMVILAHAGGSVIWVFSTTMLQTQAADRFRGRVFAADFAFMVLAMSMSTYITGAAVDLGIGVRSASLAVGLLALLPAVAWTFFALPLWDRSNP